jgi:hypothetical protein
MLKYLVALPIGWVFLTIFLIGIYHLSRMASAYIGFGEEPLVFGLLGSIAFVWIYTYLDLKEDQKRMGDRIDQLERDLRG